MKTEYMPEILEHENFVKNNINDIINRAKLNMIKFDKDINYKNIKDLLLESKFSIDRYCNVTDIFIINPVTANHMTEMMVEIYSGKNIEDIKQIGEYRFGYRNNLWGADIHMNDAVPSGMIISVYTDAYNDNKNFSVGASCSFGSN